MTFSQLALSVLTGILFLSVSYGLMSALAWLMIKIGSNRYRKEIMRLRAEMPKGQNSVINKNGERIFFIPKK